MANPEIDSIGNKIYRNKKGRVHRANGPAIIYANGDEFWIKDGMLHREDGPATIYKDKNVMWFLNGDFYSYNDYLNEVTKYISKEKLFLIRLKYG